eukprot:155138-Chlamydomonas_euryale.AAC.7
MLFSLDTLQAAMHTIVVVPCAHAVWWFHAPMHRGGSMRPYSVVVPSAHAVWSFIRPCSVVVPSAHAVWSFHACMYARTHALQTAIRHRLQAHMHAAPPPACSCMHVLLSSDFAHRPAISVEDRGRADANSCRGERAHNEGWACTQ